MKPKHTVIILAAALAASCEKSTTFRTSAPSIQTSAALSAVLDADAKGETADIHQVRQSAKPGDTITVTGRVMGNVNPFIEGRAAFILGDPTVLTACSDVPGDECKTPWDTCCDSPEDKKRGTATVQIVDAEGRVLKEGIEGVKGVEKLATLTVTGIVAAGSSVDALVINATAIDVK